MASVTKLAVTLLGAMAWLGAAVHQSLPPQPNGPCNRTAMLAAADAYVAAQVAGKLDPKQSNAADKWLYVENIKEIGPKDGVLAKALKIDHRKTNVDMTVCATYTELISASGPYVIGTQIRHDAAGKLASIDSIASTTGSWLFNATKTLSYVSKEAWDEIPVENRDKREFMQAIADAYLDVFSNATAADLIPWGVPCARLEGSMYTGKGLPTDRCTSGGTFKINSNQAPNIHRRYVIDESIGSVSVFCLWQHMMNAADSHEFRFLDSKLVLVHSMTECGGRTCKLG